MACGLWRVWWLGTRLCYGVPCVVSGVGVPAVVLARPHGGVPRTPPALPLPCLPLRRCCQLVIACQWLVASRPLGIPFSLCFLL